MSRTPPKKNNIADNTNVGDILLSTQSVENPSYPTAAQQTSVDNNNDENDINDIKEEDFEESQQKWGTFELNFAEFPIAHLTQRLPKGVNKHEIKYSDEIKGKDGKPMQRDWTIKSSAEHGLGGPSSVQVLFELMQIWKDGGFKDNKIHVGTYYNLLKRLGWDLGHKSYKQLKKDLESLYGLEIVAENAFFDVDEGKYVDLRYKPFIGWKEWKNDGKKHNADDYGYIVVNPDFHESFKRSVYQLPFNSRYFQGLSAHEQKLALYLTKIFNPFKKERKEEYRRNIYELCEQLPIYGLPSKQKYYLLDAAKKLIKRGYSLLERYKVDGDMIIFYNRQQESLHYLLDSQSKKTQTAVDFLYEDIINVCGSDEKYIEHYKWIARNIPDEIIFESLSIAKAEGKPPARLFNFLIKEYTAKRQSQSKA